jgi:hypothetical protein
MNSVVVTSMSGPDICALPVIDYLIFSTIQESKAAAGVSVYNGETEA